MKNGLRTEDFAVVDLFCGVGGLTHGLVKEGFSVSAGIDFDKTCEYAFEENNKTKFVYKDITTLSADELNQLYPAGKKKILVGCAPCQPFSIYNHKNNNNTKKQLEDSKWKLLYSFADLIEKILDLTPKQRKIMGQKAMEYIRANFDNKTMFSKTFKVYEELLS